MDLPNNDWASHLNPKTGEIVTVSDEDRHLVEDEGVDETDLPESQRERLAQARKALDARMIGRSRLAIDANRPLRHAIEIRHESFVSEDFLRLLRKHRIGLVVADTAGKWPKMFDVTADCVYVRLHGDKVIYASDNDVKVKAPYDAQTLMRKLGLTWPSDVDSRRPSRIRRVDTRVLRSREAFGPRVRGGSAWANVNRR